MKQTFLIFSGKKFIAATFLAATLFCTSVNAKAGVTTANANNVTGEKTAVQYTGSFTDALMFQVHVKNETASEFRLTVKDDNDEILFVKSYKDADYNKQFKLLKGDQYSSVYYFTITSGNKEIEQTYVVNTTSRIVDEVAVTKK